LAYLLVATWRIFGVSFKAFGLHQRYTKDKPKIHHKNVKLQLEDTPRYAKDSPVQLGVSFSCNLASLFRAQKIRQRYAKLQLKDTPRYAKDTPFFVQFFLCKFFFGPLKKKVEINKLINLFIYFNKFIKIQA
jgi:hypothetical protein